MSRHYVWNVKKRKKFGIASRKSTNTKRGGAAAEVETLFLTETKKEKKKYTIKIINCYKMNGRTFAPISNQEQPLLLGSKTRCICPSPLCQDHQLWERRKQEKVSISFPSRGVCGETCPVSKYPVAPIWNNTYAGILGRPFSFLSGYLRKLTACQFRLEYICFLIQFILVQCIVLKILNSQSQKRNRSFSKKKS